MNDLKMDLEIHLDKQVTEKQRKDKILNFYNVTNYYFEIPYEMNARLIFIYKSTRPFIFSPIYRSH